MSYSMSIIYKTSLLLLFSLLVCRLSHGQEEVSLGKRHKVATAFSFLEADAVAGMAISLRYEYVRVLDEDYRTKQAFEASFGYCANSLVDYDFTPGQSLPGSGWLLGLHSNWYYDLAPGYLISPVGQAGAGLLMINRASNHSVFDLYLSSNVGFGFRIGRAKKPFNVLLLFATQFGYKPNHLYYAAGYQIGFDWRLE